MRPRQKELSSLEEFLSICTVIVDIVSVVNTLSFFHQVSGPIVGYRAGLFLLYNNVFYCLHFVQFDIIQTQN